MPENLTREMEKELIRKIEIESAHETATYGWDLQTSQKWLENEIAAINEKCDKQKQKPQQKPTDSLEK